MDLSITAKTRKAFGKMNRKLRTEGRLPAVLYGRGKESVALELAAKEFEKVYKAAGENTLVNLEIEGNGQKKVLIHDVAHHFMSRTPIHVDFYEVDLTRKIHAKIPLHFVGASAAVKEMGGILIKTITEIEVEALPADLPPFIEVDISSLATFENFIHISDLKVPDAVKILAHPEEVVSTVQPPRTEAELAELEKPTAEAEAEAVKQVAAEPEKAEGEAGAEGGKGEEVKAEKAEKKEEPKEPKVEKKEEKK